MNRRFALKQLAIIGGGIILIPACGLGDQDAAISMSHLTIRPEHKKVLASIVDTIIPSGNSPGAMELDIHEFVLLMINDCRDLPEQEKFMNGLQQFDDYIRERYGKTFADNTPTQRENILLEIEREADNDIKGFIAQTKELTIQGYLSSKYILTEVFPYELVPGRFAGCTPA